MIFLPPKYTEYNKQYGMKEYTEVITDTCIFDR